MASTPAARTPGSGEIGLSSAVRIVTPVRSKPEVVEPLAPLAAQRFIGLKDRHLDGVVTDRLELLAAPAVMPSCMWSVHSNRFMPNFIAPIPRY